MQSLILLALLFLPVQAAQLKDTIIDNDLEITTSGTIIFEGATNDANQTTLSPVDPTADNSLLMPDNGGVLLINGDIGVSVQAYSANLDTLSGNDGSNLTGVDAATLDTLDSLQFLRSDTSDSFTGTELDISASSTLDVNGQLQIADTDISFDGASTTFTQTTGAITMAPASGSNFNLSLATTGDFTVNTNGMYFDTSAERLGINTTSPAYALEVVANNSLSFYNSIKVMPQNQTQNLDIGWGGLQGTYSLNLGTTSTDQPLRLQTASTTRMTVDNGGDIGIGTASPDALLDVAGDAIVTGDFQVNGLVNFVDGYNGELIINGNVGIATSSAPAYRLDIVASDNTQFNGLVLRPNNQTQTSRYGYAGVKNSFNYTINNSTKQHIRMVINGSEAWRLDGNGDLGIGTSTPGARLEVNGSTNFDGGVGFNTLLETSASVTTTINWNNGNKQYIDLDQTITTLNFTDLTDSTTASVQLIITQNGGTFTVTNWDADVKWPGGTAPTITSADGSIDVISCLWDGTRTDYLCQESQDFQ